MEKSIGLCGNQISVQYFLFTMHNTLTSVESDPDPSMSIINRVNNYVIKQNVFHNNKKKVGSYFWNHIKIKKFLQITLNLEE